MTAAPGWYAEPDGSTRQRWWDGTRWTEHVQDPASNVYGAVARPAVDATTPVYGPWIWLITLLPLTTLPVLLAWDTKAYMLASMSGELVLDGGYIALQLVSWVLYAGTVVCAFFDHRRLRRPRLRTSISLGVDVSLQHRSTSSAVRWSSKSRPAVDSHRSG